MLKQGTSTAAAPQEQAQELWAFFRGELVPLRDARVSVMTHAFNYGTAVFEGIRAYWNAEQQQLYGLDLVPHYERLKASARFLLMEIPYTAEDLAAKTVEILRRSGLREDVYIRPIVYKSSETIGVRLHNLDADVVIFAVPFGQYIDTEGGIRAQVSTWRRTDDNAIPARGKITGAYINGALAKSEAQLNGYDEAIVLTQDGHVSEGSAENLFIVKGGRLVTPPVTDNILEGITRRRLMALARERLEIPVDERSIDRTELYMADEVFLCGTGAQISPVVEIDRRTIGNGRVGPITRQIHDIYFDAVRGRLDEYRDWLTPVY
ncbi:MAG TPA: branched-chain amino acid transaminase [candidate division Zixibacteria bacterium]|nr:branched-chain amino acid transaminase [candidate division Zixibacteria bacterium]